MPKTIEDIIRELLKGDEQKNALDFVAHLRVSGIEIPRHAPDSYFWNPEYKGEGMCVLNITSDENGHYFDVFIQNLPDTWVTGETIDQRTKEIVWANIRRCDPTCHSKCSPGSRATICGKEFDGLCSSRLGIYSPNAETVECMKKIISAKL